MVQNGSTPRASTTRPRANRAHPHMVGAGSQAHHSTPDRQQPPVSTLVVVPVAHRDEPVKVQIKHSIVGIEGWLDVALINHDLTQQTNQLVGRNTTW